jgi:hypothetical protein
MPKHEQGPSSATVSMEIERRQALVPQSYAFVPPNVTLRGPRECEPMRTETTSRHAGGAECTPHRSCTRRLSRAADRPQHDRTRRCNSHGADDRRRRNWLRAPDHWRHHFDDTAARAAAMQRALARLLRDGLECIGEMDAWGVGWRKDVASYRSQRLARSRANGVDFINTGLAVSKHCGRSSIDWRHRKVASLRSISSWSVARSLVRSRCN